MKNLTTFALVAVLAAHALPNRERTQRGYENSGYDRSYNDFEDKNNNRGAGSSSENDCDESNGSSNNREKSYERDGHYMKGNYQDRHFSAKAFATAPAAASAQSYDYDRKDSILN